MSDGGKGSGRRPSAVADDQIADNWSNIFGLSRLEKLKRQQALEELAKVSQELGLYDEYEDKPTRYNQETQQALSR